MRRVSRRRLLRLSGAAVAVGLAGCNRGSDRPAPRTATATAAATETETGMRTTERREATATPTTETPTAEGAYTEAYRRTVDSVTLVSSTVGEGSGFVYDARHVLTNAHVVADDESVDLRFRRGEWSEGSVVGTDRYSDLAVIRVPAVPSYATPIPLLDGQATVGREVIVIGNPYGLDGTATAGIVSGVNRSIDAGTGYTIPDCVQTDAAVNPGNSGGPIVSLNGEVVAVVNAAGGDNLAFGVSAALARRVVPALLATGRYAHPYLGVSLADMTPALASANGIESPAGVYVAAVVAGGPADGVLRGGGETAGAEGVRVSVGGDVIRAADGEAVLTVDDFGSYLALRKRPGDSLSLTILRDATRRTVEVAVGSRAAP
ncbi:S1C family serine protease [Halogeometricum luteum]|uniref:Trypsin-like peptidase domain-containing protein n=1 Tax=Halogeometricum luteum TaxID=2950537 RepID=A0ABU2G4F8_9EURY|nr:trypsin-like peptidase domain-containing protein [Halogeometricum sp. S3BR5-2]MDS0295670.1 trypsin-like peptidase domain-containing protein [Halogeometricum sp. S3BR5-2]